MLNQLVRHVDAALYIKGEVGINFCGDAPWNNLEDFYAKVHKKFL